VATPLTEDIQRSSKSLYNLGDKEEAFPEVEAFKLEEKQECFPYTDQNYPSPNGHNGAAFSTRDTKT